MLNRKLIGALAALVIICLIGVCPGLGEGTSAGGTAGDLTWNYSNTLLTISGEGDMPDYTADDPAPWHEYAGSITHVDLGVGVQSVGANAFDGVPAGLTLTLVNAELNLSGVAVPQETTVVQGEWRYDCLGWNEATSARITGWTGSGASVTVPETLNGLTVIAVGHTSYDVEEAIFTQPFDLTLPASVTLNPYTVGEGVAVHTGVWDYNIVSKQAFITGVAEGTNIQQVTIPGKLNGINVYSVNASAFEGLTVESLTLDNADIRLPLEEISPVTIHATSVLDHALWTYTVDGETLIVTDCAPSSFGRVQLQPNLHGVRPTKIAAGALTDKGIAQADLSGCNKLTIARGAVDPDTVILGYEGFKYTLSGDEAVIHGTNYDNNSHLGDLTVPAAVNDGYVVTGVGDGAFDNKGVTSLVLPDTLATIGESAFSNNGLAAVTLPETVTSVGDAAFKNNSISELILPDGVTSVGAGAFEGNDITEVTLPGFDTVLGAQAFDEDVLVTSDAATSEWIYTVHGGNCTIIGWNGTAADLVVPADINGLHVTKFGPAVFKGKTFLKSVVLPDDTEEMGAELFSGCTSLTTADLGDRSAGLPAQLFMNCRNLNEVTLPGALKTVGAYAFGGCGALTGVTLPEGVTEIQHNAFNRCAHMTEITLPSTLVSVGMSAFSNCNSLTAISLPDSLTTLGDSVFSGCTALADVTIGTGLQTIASNTFRGLPALKTLTVNSRNATISSGAFSGCSALQTVFIDTAAIEGSAFANCAALKTFTLLEGSISSPCFSGCTSLESVVLGDESAALGMYDEFGNLLDEGFEYEILRGVSSIPSNAFQSLPALRRVVLYGSLTEVPYGAFQSDVALEEVKLSPAITRIASYAFSGDSALHSMAFSDNLTQIDSYAFQNCTSFDALTLPGQMTSVSSYAFYGCGLESITFTGTVQTIGSYAFAQNAGLVEIQIPDGVVTISDHAFDGCAALERAYIPNSVQTVGASAFPATTRVYCDPSSQAARSISQNGGSFVSPDNETFGIRLLLDGEFSLGLSVEQVWTDESAIVIPEYIGGEMVTEVGASTFTSCPTVTEVTFPASVQEIPAGLCKDNDRLVKVNLPEGVTRIREGAFQNCAHLADVSFPSTLTIIEKDAFAGCPLLVEARLSDNIQQIGENAFPNTKVYCRLNSDTARMLSRTGGSFICEEYPLLKLKYLMDGTVVKSLEVVGSEAAETIIVPEGVTSIAAEAFKDNVTLKNITLPDSLTSIGAYAFAGSGVVNVTLPAGVREIPDYAFYNAASLTSLTLKDEGVITSIGAHAFDGSGVTSLAFPEGLQTVGAAAFANTPRLSACDLPDSVTALGSAESWTEADGVFYNAAALTSFTVPAGVTEITNSAFAKTSALTSVTIPEGVTKVGSYAFKESHLASVTLPSTVKEVHYGAFQDCIDLKRVSMSGDMDTMGGYVFSGCINLESVTMPDTLRTMESYVFQNCKKLTDITLPDGLNTIYGNTFDGCTRLGHVKVGDGTVVIDNYAFQSCSALTSVELPASLRKIGRQAFSSTGLTSIAIPDGVTTIEEYAFSNCSALTSVILPDSVVSLGRGAFQSCNNLTEVRLPAGISLLPEYLLYNTKITSVTVPDGVRSISDSAFSDCYQLKSILIPASVESIGDDALRNISPSQVTVYCYVGTEADAFAQNKGYQIVYLDGSQALNGLTIEPSGATELSMGLGHTLNDIDALFCVKPDGAPYLPAMAFSVSDEAVAQVDGTDLTGLTVGQVTLTASFVDNPAITSSVTVHVRENVTDYALTDPIWQKKDEPLTLMPESTVPAGANDGYVWEIDRALGTIEGNVLTPTAFGKGTLSATSWNGLKRSATIYIYEDPTEIWFTGVPAGMDIGGTTDLNLYVKAGAVFTGEEALHFVTYSSSDESIATVDQAGHVTATGYGDAVITAEAGNGVKGTCDIHVSKPITSFRLKQDIYAPIGSVVELYAVDIEPADANPNAFSWECTPAGLVEYENGRITVLTEQECEVTITATAWNNPNVRQTTNLNIYRPVVEEITIEPVNAWNYVPVNSEVQLTAHVKATTMFENQLVTWSIVNPEQWSTYNRPTVDSKGLLDVSRMSSGWGDRVTVRATADNGVYDELTLRVYYPIETFELPERYTIQTGETVTVTPTKAYNNSTGETDLMNYCPAFTMSVTGSHLAEIDGMTLTGLQPGETELTVTSWNGTSRTVHVLVYNPIETVEVYTVESKNGRYSLSDPMRDLFAQMNYRAHSKAISDKTYTDDLVTWTSSDSTVIRVDNPVTGEFRTLKYGTAILTATAANGVVGQIELNVRVQVDTFTAPELIEAPVMADTILTVDAYAPENAYDGFVWRLQEAGYGYIEGNILHVTADTPVDGLHLYVSDWNGYNLNKEVILNIVRMPVTDVTLDALPGDEIGVGGDYQLTAHVKAGADYVNKFVTWASSDETVATVSPEGVVHALAAGEVTITATAINTDEDGQPIAASLTLTSVQGVDSFAVSPEEITLFMGESTELTISDIQPEDATVREFAYSVEPEGIATVEDGVLTPSITESVEGTLTVTSWNGTGVQVPLHLIYPTIEKVETEPIEGMFLNETADLVAHVTVNGVEYINRFVTWSTDGAVTVDESGLITPQYKGTAHIYLADALTGERLETLTFDVTQPLQDFGVRLNDSYIEIGDVNVHNFNVENMTPDDADYDFEYAIAGGGEITGTDVMSYEEPYYDENGSYMPMYRYEPVAYYRYMSNRETTLTLTATDRLTGLSKSVDIPVRYSLSEFSAFLGSGDAASNILTVGEEQDLNVTARSEAAYYMGDVDIANLKLSYASSDESVATVDENGHITAVGTGTAKITVTHDLSGMSAAVDLRVARSVESFRVEPAQIDIFTNESQTITIDDIVPEDATAEDLIFTVEPEGIATVENGVLTPIVTESATGRLIVSSYNGVSVEVPLNIVYPKVESIEVEPIEDMNVGDTQELVARVTVNGSEYVNRFISWSSGDGENSVVTIDENGLITAKARGDAVITLTNSVTGDYLTSISFCVRQPMTDFEVRAAQTSLEVGDTASYGAYVSGMTPDDADHEFSFAISEGAVYDIDSYMGTATFSYNGDSETVLTITLEDAVSGLTRSIDIPVWYEIGGMETALDGQTGTAVMGEGQSGQLSVTAQGSGMYSDGKEIDGKNLKLSYASSDESVATVDENGTVTAIGTGTAQITVTHDHSGVSAEVTVRVAENVTGFDLPSRVLVPVGGSAELIVSNLQPETAQIEDLIWTIEPEGIAKVEDGVVIPLINTDAEGTITATSVNGVSRTAALAVYAPWVTRIEFDPLPYPVVDGVQRAPIDVDLPVTAHVFANGDSGEREYVNQLVTFEVYVDESHTYTIGDYYWGTVDHDTGVIHAANNSNFYAYLVATADNGESAEMRIRFVPSYDSFELKDDVILLPKGESGRVQIGGYTASHNWNLDNNYLKYETDRSDIAYIDGDGNIYYQGNEQTGVTNVAVRTVNGVERQAKVIYYTDEDIEGVEIVDAPEYAPIYKNLDLEAQVTLFGEKVTNKLITWTSSDTSVINVTSSGAIRTLGYGTATLTATTPNGHEDSVTITVMQTLNDFSLPQDLTVTYGDALTLEAASVSPENAPLRLTWTAEPEGYVTIDGSVLTPLVNEDAQITLTAVNWDGMTRTTTLTLHKGFGAADFRLPSGLRVIEEEAFAGVPARAVLIPDGCESIGARAFADCPNLERVYVPASVTEIADSAFSGSGPVTIFGAAGSAAETYASEHGMAFVAD